jgi:signal transduction histidine kinase
VRVRVLAAMLALLVLAMLVTGLELTVAQLARVDAGVTDALTTQVAEFRSILEGGDPATGEPWGDVPSAVAAGVERQVPNRFQDVAGLVDGAVTYRPRENEPPQIPDEPELLAAVAGLTEPASGEVAGSNGPLRWAGLPVRVQGDPRQGLLLVAVDVEPQRAAVWEQLRTYAAASVITLIVVGLVGWFLAGRLLRPLRDLRDTAERISETDLTQRLAVEGSDEISDLSATFNAMLDRLETAFDEQRRFLDDAGHELRTPLTIVSGHLQVMDVEDPADVAGSRALVLDEVARMSRLVNDLIVLAKAERPDFVQPQPLDVAPLVAGALDKARGLADRDWAAHPGPALHVQADPERVTQALLQLATNAVRHTSPGDRITFGWRRDPGFAVVWVADTGAGFGDQDLDALFDRFTRGNRPRGEGTGLGLAIVASIAAAHGGHATARHADSGGAQVEVHLPLTPGQDAPVEPR